MEGLTHIDVICHSAMVFKMYTNPWKSHDFIAGPGL